LVEGVVGAGAAITRAGVGSVRDVGRTEAGAAGRRKAGTRKLAKTLLNQCGKRSFICFTVSALGFFFRLGALTPVPA